MKIQEERGQERMREAGKERNKRKSIDEGEGTTKEDSARKSPDRQREKGNLPSLSVDVASILEGVNLYAF